MKSSVKVIGSKVGMSSVGLILPMKVGGGVGVDGGVVLSVHFVVDAKGQGRGRLSVGVGVNVSKRVCVRVRVRSRSFVAVGVHVSLPVAMPLAGGFIPTNSVLISWYLASPLPVVCYHQSILVLPITL